MNDCGQGVRYVDFTGGVEFFEVRLNDDGSNPECIKSLDEVCLALTFTTLSEQILQHHLDKFHIIHEGVFQVVVPIEFLFTKVFLS